MFQLSVPHHDTGCFESHRTRLPDTEYGIALDNIVKGCTDMLLLSADRSRYASAARARSAHPPDHSANVSAFSHTLCLACEPSATS